MSDGDTLAGFGDLGKAAQVSGITLREFGMNDTLIAKLARITAEVPAFEKGGTNTQQKYSFVSIEQIVQYLRPLLAREGVMVLPAAIDESYEERQSKSGGVITVCHMRVTWKITDGTTEEIVMSIGESNDSGDKAGNKAFTAAWKQVLTKVFGVSAEPDNDASTPEERAPRQQSPRPAQPPPPAQPSEQAARNKAYAQARHYLEMVDPNRENWRDIIVSQIPRLEGKSSGEFTAEDWEHVTTRMAEYVSSFKEDENNDAGNDNSNGWGEALGEV